MNVDIFGLVYGVLVIVGGIIGFILAQSTVSLISGALFGSIAAYGAFTLNYYCLLGTSVVLGIIMSVRFLSGGKFMPSGLIAILSLLLVIRCIVYFIKKV